MLTEKKGNPPSENDDITTIGEKDARLVEALICEFGKINAMPKVYYLGKLWR